MPGLDPAPFGYIYTTDGAVHGHSTHQQRPL